MTEDELEDHEESEELGSWRFQPVVIVMRLIQLFGNLCNAYQALAAGLCEDIAAHINYKIERAQFEAEAGKELEVLVKGEDG